MLFNNLLSPSFVQDDLIAMHTTLSTCYRQWPLRTNCNTRPSSFASLYPFVKFPKAYAKKIFFAKYDHKEWSQIVGHIAHTVMSINPTFFAQGVFICFYLRIFPRQNWRASSSSFSCSFSSSGLTVFGRPSLFFLMASQGTFMGVGEELPAPCPSPNLEDQGVPFFMWFWMCIFVNMWK